jgi:hypothetical protein
VFIIKGLRLILLVTIDSKRLMVLGKVRRPDGMGDAARQVLKSKSWLRKAGPT